jgi:SAM-dependent methyltransferase
MKSISNRTSYDDVPYDSHPFAQTHADRLATVARLLGLRAVPVSRCRVLELGSAAGGNLIPMAMAFPDSTFVGIDLSGVQIDEGLEMVRALELKNIELKTASILDVGPDFGKFDYIICHGVYSWVPNQVQDKILDICCRNLSPNGVAYVSYNTYPGWHMRGMIRDMLGYHARQFVEPQTRVKQARNLLDFLAKASGGDNNPYGLLLKQELESVRRSSDSYLYHEHLEDVNEPIYFHQFAERAAAHGLRYLGEVDLRVMVPSNYPPDRQRPAHAVAGPHPPRAVHGLPAQPHVPADAAMS